MFIPVIVRVDLYYEGETLKSLGKVKLRMRSIVSLTLLCSIPALLPCCNSESFPTYILSENLEQEVTSSALNWVSADTNFKNYDEAVIGAYPSDSSDDNTINKPVYVCRARLKGSWLAGHLRPSDKKCVVSLYGNVHHSKDYQILINTENTARLSWVLKTKLTSIIQGAVLGGQESNKNFVGRTRAKKDSIWTYILGYMDPSENFGKYFFVNDKSEQVESEDGELLVEAEPKSYEYTNIQYDSSKKPPHTEEKMFGTAILKNDESNNTAKVVSVIPYNYRHKVSWGGRHGLTTGLPLYIYHKNRPVDKYAWGLPYDNDEQYVQQIEYILEPGTAVNVTLTAKYVDAEIPYTATLVSIFKEGDKMERTIKDTLKEAMLQDITPIYSPVYYLHNNSLVPTTTTTTTTSTTTEAAKKTTTMETHPIDAPEMQVTDKIKGQDADMKDKSENEVMSDQEDTVGSMIKPENSSGDTSPPSIFLSKAFVLSTILLLILRLT